MKQLVIGSSITNRTSYSIEKYLQEVSRMPLLNPEEEMELAQHIRKNPDDQAARERLVKANLRFVISVAKQYPNSVLSLNDLINEGNWGLTKAVDKFDPTRGFKFISYAVWWIRQSILAAFNESARQIKLPANQAMISNKIKKAIDRFLVTEEREPTNEEIAEILNISVDHVDLEASYRLRTVSFDGPSLTSDGEDDGSYMHERVADPNAVIPGAELEHKESLKIEIENHLEKLPPKDARLIRKFFGIGCEEQSVESIAVELEITPQAVRVAKDKALGRFKKESVKKKLRKYLQ